VRRVDVSILAPVRDYIGSLVHPSVRHDVLASARHRAFIALRLMGGLAALAAMPLVLVFRGIPTAFDAILIAWLITPILLALYLSRTGRFERAHLLSSFATTILLAVVAIDTGGIASFAATWLVLVPLQAVLSASRRVIHVAALTALGAVGLLLALGICEALPVRSPSDHAPLVLAAVSISSSLLYAMALALATESTARTGRRLLDEAQDRNRLLARNMTDVIIRHGRQGAVLSVSPAAEPLFGIGVDALRGHGLFDRIHVGDRPSYLTALADAARGAARSVEFRLRRGALEPRPATFVWIEMRCRPLGRARDERCASEEGEVVSVMRDISERKIQEEAIERARLEAERATAAKSRFLTTIGHELRTPLNAIIGFSEMLINGEAISIDTARQREYAQLIKDSGQHLLSVVNAVLDMSRIETGHFQLAPEPFAPASVIGNCCDLLALKAREAGIDIVVRQSPGLPEIMADKRAVKQILINLLSNAVKFTDRGGQVSVTATAQGRFVEVTVEDTGVGIGEEHLPRLGDPFFQVRGGYDRQHDGTGLGLSIVKGLLALQGGDMEISSRVGVGTRVTIRLPVKAEMPSCDQEAPKLERIVPAAQAPSASMARMKKRA
jgi:two-component system, cell cycle sensor histidine kinase DivJ